MRFAIIESGRVVNVAEADEAFGAQQGWIASETAGIGDLWDGSTFTRPMVSVQVPQTVTRRQAKQALLLANKLHLVQPAIDAIADATQRALMQIEWDESQEFQRTRPSLIAMATAIGLDSDALDALFIQAAKL